MKKTALIIIFGFFLVSLPALSPAGDIEDVDRIIQTSMDDVLKVVKDSETNDSRKRGLLWEIVLKTFDFEKITEFALGLFSSKSSTDLGPYSDRRFSPEQHAEFQKLFTKHLGNTYLDRLEFDNFDVKIDVAKAEMMKSVKGMKRAVVKTVINDKTLIDYMMLKRDGKWRVYDLKVEGRSLVSAFRKEYKSILLKNKPDYLINLIKGKIAEHEAAKAKADAGQ